MRRQPFADHHLLLVAAREGLHRLLPAEGFHLQAFGVLVRQFPFTVVMQHAVRIERAKLRQADVLGNRQGDNRPLFLPFFRHADNTGFDRIRRLAEAPGLSVEDNFPGRWPRDAGKRLHQFGTPGTHQPVKAEDFPFTQGERDMRKLGRMAEVLHLQHRLAFFAVDFREGLGNGAPDHHRHHPLLGDLIYCPCTDEHAVAQNGVVIGQLKNLVELVGDKQDGFSLLL